MIWRGCECFGVLPPGVQKAWDDCNPWVQASLIAYTDIREFERNERDVEFANAMTPQVPRV